MTATLAAEQRMRRDHLRYVDYDASAHVLTAAATVLHGPTGWTPRTEGQRHAGFLLVYAVTVAAADGAGPPGR